jgi:hypothetical protein
MENLEAPMTYAEYMQMRLPSIKRNNKLRLARLHIKKAKTAAEKRLAIERHKRLLKAR